MANADAWAVAAALLIEEGKALHYNKITSRILDTGLSGLADRGKTPEQTLGVVMRKCLYPGSSRKVFKQTGNGYYDLQNVEDAKSIPQVKSVLDFLQRRREAKKPVVVQQPDELSQLRAEVKALRERNVALEARLKQIVVICKEV